jgi:hypothetical protein
VQMAMSDHEAQRKSSLSDCTWLENEYGSVDLETLKFLMHFREPESSLYFILFYFILFLHILIFFSFSHAYIFSLFLSFSLYSFFIFLSHHFLFAPL